MGMIMEDDFGNEYGFYRDGPNDDEEEDNMEKNSSLSRDKSFTRRTVRAIQHLCQEGRISVEQKRRLLNEIIQHANDEVPSMVEIAYELLLHSEEEDENEEDDEHDKEDNDEKKSSVDSTSMSRVDGVEKDL